MSFQISLEAARKNAGFKRAGDAARLVGIHEQTLLKLEKDSTDIPFSVLSKLSDLYQVPKNNIFLGKKYDLIRTIEIKREKQNA